MQACITCPFTGLTSIYILSFLCHFLAKCKSFCCVCRALEHSVHHTVRIFYLSFFFLPFESIHTSSLSFLVFQLPQCCISMLLGEYSQNVEIHLVLLNAAVRPHSLISPRVTFLFAI